MMVEYTQSAAARITRPSGRIAAVPRHATLPGPARDFQLIPRPASFAIAAGAGIVLVLLAHFGALYLLYTGGQLKRSLARLFLLDWEGNFATFYNFSLFVCAFAATCLAAAVAFRTGNRWRWHWSVLAALMLVLSFDEAARLHESLIPLLADYSWAEGPLYFGWVVPGAIFVAGFALTYIGFLRAMPRRIGGLMLLSGLCYVAGAIGVEMLGAIQWDANEGRSLAYELTATVEEVLEMSGLVLFTTAVLGWLVAETRGLRWTFAPD